MHRKMIVEVTPINIVSFETIMNEILKHILGITYVLFYKINYKHVLLGYYHPSSYYKICQNHYHNNY